MYDIIGDIHGHADELVKLLDKLGYKKNNFGRYFHPQDRKVIFLGDFIDRGPKIKEVLEIARSMVDYGNAFAVLGNHELNSLAFHTPNPFVEGEFLRPRTLNNQNQIKATLDQLGDSLNYYLDWFRTLPLWMDLDGFRVIHASWDLKAIKKVENFLKGNVIGGNKEFLSEAYREEGCLFESVEHLLKGKEFNLPNGFTFPDFDGQLRTTPRARWYLDPINNNYSYRQYAWQFPEVDCDEPLKLETLDNVSPYGSHEKPIFIGHYWLSDYKPSLLAPNVACLDYSVARKGGFLCAYSHRGEAELSDSHFVW